ncbi:MAG: DUF5591 domain-containing protein [Thermoplasmata archaeon]|nr:DUF5591 domain-containing protein [Thermoplasmata archaeon]
MVRGPTGRSDLARLGAARPSLIVLANARALWRDGEPFVRAIADLREAVGAGPVLWAPRVALPNRIAWLTYVSVDLLDTTEGLWQSAEGVSMDATFGRHEPTSPATSEIGSEYRAEMERVRHAIIAGRLRDLVEMRQGTEPALAEMLRYTDQHLGTLLEERTPVVENRPQRYVYKEAGRRPEIRRFQERLQLRYAPPPSKSVLLLIPCSRTKPYRQSPSHRRFSRAWADHPCRARLHTVSVTSPLGVVPRELEDVYPAPDYDIPVTGEWDPSEREPIVRGVERLLASGAYRHILVHLDPEEYSWLEAPLRAAAGTRDVVWSGTDDRSTSPESIRVLTEAVSAALEDSPGLPGGPLASVRDELESLARFQFGAEAATLLFRPPVRLMGRPWFQRVIDPQHRDLLTWREERGLFHLTMAGAERLGPSELGVVTVEPGFELTGDVFTPGVVRADPGIRTGDAVRVAREGRLLAVGEATLPGRLMRDLPHGLAVRVRHRRAEERSEKEPPTLERVESEEPYGPVV